MRAGLLRTRIKLLRYEEVKDSAGGIVGDWVEYASPMAEDKTISTRSLLSGGSDINQEIHTIRIRFRNDIKSTDRVMLPDGRILTMSGMPKASDQKRRELILTCEYNV